MHADHIESFTLRRQYFLSKLENKKIDINKIRNFFKITGRYYIDGFDNILNRMGEHDIYVQHINNPAIEWQHSEVFGFNKKYAEDIFKPVLNGLTMEKRLWEVSHGDYSVGILPAMPNVLKVVRGGDGLLVDPL